MDTKELTAILVVAMVGCVIVAGFFPVVGESVSATTTFENEGVFNYGIFTPDDEYTFTYDSNTNTLTANGEPVTVSGVDTTTRASYSILASENVLIRYGATSTYIYLQIVGIDTNGIGVSANVGANQTATVTIENGKIVVSYGLESEPATKTFDFTELYGIVANESEAVMKVSNEAVYIKGDSPLYASGLTNVTAWNNAFHFEGTYKDGIVISSPNNPDATFDNITWNIDPVDGYIDLYKLTSVEFDITIDETTVHATYSFFGVPSSVTAEKAIHADDNTASIISMLPFILIMGIVLMFVGVVIVRRYV